MHESDDTPPVLQANSKYEGQTESHINNFDLIDLFNLLYGKKFIVLAFSFFITLCGAIYSLNATPYYASKIIFTAPPENLMGGTMGAADILGGVGSVLGVGGKTSPMTSYALSTLESREFLTKFFLKYDLMPHLLPQYWDAKTKIWRPIERSLLGKTKDMLLGEEPNFIENEEEKRAELAFKEFKDRMSINVDKTSDIITLNLEWTNPILASKWANQMLAMLNETMRARTIAQSQERVEFLQNEIDSTKIANVRSILYSMMENELKTSMLANVQKDYSFTIIDSAYPTSRPYRPRKIVILMLSMISGFLMISVYLMAKNYITRLKEAKNQ